MAPDTASNMMKNISGTNCPCPEGHFLLGTPAQCLRFITRIFLAILRFRDEVLGGFLYGAGIK